MRDINKLTLNPPYYTKLVAAYLNTRASILYRILDAYDVIYKVPGVEDFIILNDNIIYYDKDIKEYVFTEYGFEWIKSNYKYN